MKHKFDLFLKEINGFMLNVTDQYSISPATRKGAFSRHPGDCHESVIYVTGHVSHGSEAQGLLPALQDSQKHFSLPSLPLALF